MEKECRTCLDEQCGAHQAGCEGCMADYRGPTHWKPKDETPGNSARADERTCSMTKTPVFWVVLVQEPTEMESRELGKIGRIVWKGLVTARDSASAIVKAMAELGKEKDAKYDTDKIVPSVRPFE